MATNDPYDIEGIIDYYVNLLIIQYANQPKAQATIELFVTQVEANGLLFQIRDAFDIDTAIGVQLDTLGKYIGVNRYFNGQTLSGYFSLIPQGTNPIGWGGEGFTTQSGFTASPYPTLIYADILSTTQALTDDAYRQILLFQIINNSSNFSHQSIDQNLFNFFGTGIRAESAGNMTMVYFVTRQYYQTALIAYQKGILPKPMGVQLQYIIEEDVPFFGMTSYSGAANPFATGFTTQAAYATSVGQTLDYGDLTI